MIKENKERKKTQIHYQIINTATKGKDHKDQMWKNCKKTHPADMSDTVPKSTI